MASKTPTKKKTQTTTIAGARVIITTSASGKVTIKPAPIEEWVLQAAGVRALRAMPEYVDNADDAKPGTFTLAGDFNAARRSMREQVKAKATGLAAGEHDLRISMYGGRLGLIEYKAAKTPVSADQRKRHALLAALGFTRQAILRATTEAEAARLAVDVVRGWLDADALPDSKAASAR
jgi:hypothetical protein